MADERTFMDLLISEQATPDQVTQIKKARRRMDVPENDLFLEKAEDLGLFQWQQGASPETAAPPEQISAKEATFRAAQEGFSLGQSEELAEDLPRMYEGMRAGSERMRARMGGEAPAQPIQPGPIHEATEGTREAELARNEEARKQHGGKMMGTELLTAAPAGIVTAAAAPSVAGQIVTGAGMGGLYAAGDVDYEDPELWKRVRNGMLFSGGMAAGANAMMAAAPLFRKMALHWGRKAVGFIQSVVNKVGGPQKADDAVAVLLDEGAIKGNLEQISERVTALRETAGETISEVLGEVDALVGKGVFSAKQLADKMLNAPMPGMFKSKDVPMTFQDFLDMPMNNTLKSQFDDIMATAATFSEETLLAAQSFKQALKTRINFAKDMAEKNMFLRAYLTARDMIDETIMQTAPKLDDPAMAQRFFDAKRSYAAARNAEKAIDNELRRATGNRIMSLTDWIWLANAGSPAAAAAGVAAKKVMESSRGLGFLARTANRGATIAEKVGRPVGRAGTAAAIPLGSAAERVRRGE